MMPGEVIAALERIYRRVILVIGRGRIKTGDDKGNIQKLQVQLGADEIRDNTPRMAEYGFTSMPPADTDAMVIFVGGDRSNGIIIATGNQTFRMKNLATGEVALYDDLGQSVHLTRSGIVVKGAGLPVLVTDTPHVTLDTPLVTMTQDLRVNGNVKVDGSLVADGDVSDHTSKSMAGMRQVYNGHHNGATPPPSEQM